jgi:hypothetical protein
MARISAALRMMAITVILHSLTGRIIHPAFIAHEGGTRLQCAAPLRQRFRLEDAVVSRSVKRMSARCHLTSLDMTTRPSSRSLEINQIRLQPTSKLLSFGVGATPFSTDFLESTGSSASDCQLNGIISN